MIMFNWLEFVKAGSQTNFSGLNSLTKMKKMRTIRGLGSNGKIFYRRKPTLGITSSSLFPK